MTVFIFCVLFSVLVLTSVRSTHVSSSGESYTHKTVLRENVYDVYWKYDSSLITFEVEVATTGWVGFGFSPNGGMTGSDIVIGGVNSDGKPYFSDRHATGTSTPSIDRSDDYELLHSSQNQTRTTLRFRRKLDTCDNDDMLINSDTFRLIFAYGSSDTVSYHNSNRGTKSVLLLGAITPTPVLPNDVITWDFDVSNVTVPAKDTVYWCKGFNVPSLAKKHHVLKYEPVITPGNEALTHHIIIYACYGDVNTTGAHLLNAEHCGLMPNNLQPSCTSVLFAWAIGGEAFFYPSNVGLPFGDDQQPTFLLLEIHYDNPTKASDLVDSSGMRLTLSPTLRQYDAGLIEFGHIVYPTQAIPPNQPSFTSYGYCVSDCTKEGLASEPDGIKIFAGALHSHLLGRKMRLRHIRNGIEQEPMFADNNYDFNYQEMVVRKKEKVVLPGDEFQMECELSSSKKSSFTYGGLATTDEMCLAFVLYYPRVNLTKCLSTPYNFSLFFQGKGFDETYDEEKRQMVITSGEYKGLTEYEALTKMTWDVMNAKELETAMKNSPYHVQCRANGEQRLSASNRPRGTYNNGLTINKVFPESPRQCPGQEVTTPVNGSPSAYLNVSLLISLLILFSVE